MGESKCDMNKLLSTVISCIWLLHLKTALSLHVYITFAFDFIYV